MGTRGHLRAVEGADRPSGDLLTVDDVADVLHCSRRQVFRLIRRGDLPSIKPGRQRLVTPGALADYVQPTTLAEPPT